MNVAYMEQLQKEATENKLDSRAKWMLLRADLVGENTVLFMILSSTPPQMR